MLNIYVDKEVKEVELFRESLSSVSADFNVFSAFHEILPEHVDVAIIWMDIPDCLNQFTNLKLLLTSGSGIDHLLPLDNIPENLPTVRLVDHKLRNKVADYVLDAVHKYQALIKEPDNSKITVGIMGLGLISKCTAIKLRTKKYQVISWAKQQREYQTADVFVGQKQLIDFAMKAQVVVCQLPLTSETEDILCADLFKKMQKGSYIINVGRGKHLKEIDLIDNIRSGHLRGACLDVFREEPLPERSCLRNEPSISLTPHIAGGIFPIEQAKYAGSVIETFFKKGQVEGQVNKDLNY